MKLGLARGKWMLKRWPYRNPMGLASVMEGSCPPHFRDMRAANDALCERKFGPGGPFHPDTPGPWKESRKIWSAAPVHSEEFKECMALPLHSSQPALAATPWTELGELVGVSYAAVAQGLLEIRGTLPGLTIKRHYFKRSLPAVVFSFLIL